MLIKSNLIKKYNIMGTSTSKSQGQFGSLLVSILFIVVGLITLYDTTSYSDRDSQVFPQTVAIILIITAGISLVARILKPSNEGGFGKGIWWRRVLFISAMFITCFAMPIIGFLASGIIAFISGLIAAMHDKWSIKTAFIYGCSGAIIMISFFILFKFILFVPLP